MDSFASSTVESHHILITLPGLWDFVKRDEPAKVGVTSLKNTTLAELKRPRRTVPPLDLIKAAQSTIVAEALAADTPASVTTSPEDL